MMHAVKNYFKKVVKGLNYNKMVPIIMMRKSHELVMKIVNANNIVYSLLKRNVEDHKQFRAKLQKDIAEISDKAKVMNKVDNFMNLGSKDRMDISDLSEDEKAEFLKIISNLMKEGIVGYEEIEVNGQVEKHYLTNQIGDKRIYGAKPKMVIKPR